jgi:hypothetical protein
MRNRDEKLTRRSFLAKMATAGAVTVGAGYLVGCKSEGGGGSSEKKPSGGGGAKADACTDLSGLTDAEKQTRQSLGYVDKSTQAGKNCKNCSLYQPEKYAEGCGGCQVMKGPVAEAGYCTAWAAKS